jgi:hypothetical protein
MSLRIAYEQELTASSEHLPENAIPRILIKQSSSALFLQHVTSNGPLQTTLGESSAKTAQISAAGRNCLTGILD